MKCYYCFDTFDLDTKLPIKLSCSHSFCKECIGILKDTITYCPIDNLKVNYSLEETDQDVLDELNFKCSQHDSYFIGVCFDHCCPFCEECYGSHSACQIFKGTRKEINKKIIELFDLASIKKSILIKNESSPSIFHLDHLVESVESHLKTLDALQDKFEKNFLNQEEKEKFLKNIEPIIKNKGDSSKIFSEEGKNQSLIKPLPNLEGLDFMKILESMQINTLDQKVGLEFQFINSGFLSFFRQITVNTEEYGKYFCNFRHIFADFVIVYGCGFGTPSIEGGSIYISCFEIRVNDENYSEEIGIVEFIPDRLTSKINFKNSIIFPRDTDMFFHIEIEGTSNYLFKVAELKNVCVNDLGDKAYLGHFPILYLLISR